MTTNLRFRGICWFQEKQNRVKGIQTCSLEEFTDIVTAVQAIQLTNNLMPINISAAIREDDRGTHRAYEALFSLPVTAAFPPHRSPQTSLFDILSLGDCRLLCIIANHQPLPDIVRIACFSSFVKMLLRANLWEYLVVPAADFGVRILLSKQGSLSEVRVEEQVERREPTLQNNLSEPKFRNREERKCKDDAYQTPLSQLPSPTSRNGLPGPSVLANARPYSGMPITSFDGAMPPDM